jgi:hypothetical protein
VSNSQARVEEVFAEAARLFASKNASYQDSWRDQGWRGNVARVMEKAKRIRSLLWRPSVLLNGSKEHPRETLMDVINTCAFAIINMDDGVEWGEGVDSKPVAPPQGWPDWAPGPPTVEDETGWPLAPHEVHQRGQRLNDPVPANANETTLVDVPVPGEEKPSPKPRNRTVTDKGSGPRQRPIKDVPQA